jgi:N-acetylgalactosamine kinase
MTVSGGDQFGESEQRRTSALLKHYRRVYRRPAAFVVRAPGRVNLLGEHTDYNGLPVLPMAIDRSVLIAGAPRDDRCVTVGNVAPQFASRSYTLAESIPAFSSGDWGNYSKAAAQGMVRHCAGQLERGADLLVDGDIPRGAGLSSSSALVVASALALIAANDIEVPYETLAELLPLAERYVGTLSGGMDQAVSLLARAGHALRLDFFPLRVRTVPLPAGVAVVVCHSLVPAEKSSGAQHGYNLRVIECRLGCRVLERALGSGLPRGLRTLGDLVTLFPGRPLLEFLEYLQLAERPLSVAEIAAAVGTSPERLRSDCGIGRDSGDHFNLVRRVRHVFSEAERVNQAEDYLRAGDAAGFGRLMAASHGSCRDDYEISCPELEALVSTAMHAGAIGARLTGAGFGGCSVNLVFDADVHTFLQRIDRDFYAARLPAGAQAGDYRFIFKPQGGACVQRMG